MTRLAPKQLSVPERDPDAPDGEVTDEERTHELPAVAVPAAVGLAEKTVPVTSSLERSLQHEMLRRESEGDGGD
jgi:hypothetical protein